MQAVFRNSHGRGQRAAAEGRQVDGHNAMFLYGKGGGDALRERQLDLMALAV